MACDVLLGFRDVHDNTESLFSNVYYHHKTLTSTAAASVTRNTAALQRGEDDVLVLVVSPAA